MTNFKAGDLVRIKDNAKEIVERTQDLAFPDAMKDMLGEVLEVKDVTECTKDYCYVYTADKSEEWIFPFEALEPVIDDNLPDDMEDQSINQYKQDYLKIAEAIAGEGYTVVEDIDYVNETTKFNTILKPIKGFNPEKLTFDGVEIVAGDKITVWGLPYALTVIGGEVLYVEFSNAELPVVSLNITSHYPKKDKELERLEAEVKKAINKIYALGQDKWDVFTLDAENALETYYQARLALDNYKENNK